MWQFFTGCLFLSSISKKVVVFFLSIYYKEKFLFFFFFQSPSRNLFNFKGKQNKINTRHHFGQLFIGFFWKMLMTHSVALFTWTLPNKLFLELKQVLRK